MHGDIVVVRLPAPSQIPKKHREKVRRTVGQIVNVLRRENEYVVGTFKKTKQLLYVAPDNPRLFRDIYVAKEVSKEAKPGEKVVVRITEWPSRHLNPEGEITEILGVEGDPKVDLLSLVYQFKLPDAFSKKILDEAKTLAKTFPVKKLKTGLIYGTN